MYAQLNTQSNTQPTTRLNAPHISNGLSLEAYLTVQLQEIICMGPGHTMMWADNKDHQPIAELGRRENRHDWLQVSVQGGAKCHLMIQFLLPETFTDAGKRRMDTLFAQYGWTTELADGRECLVYYVAQSPDARRLLDEAEFAAQQCAIVMTYLWQARNVEDIALLGARGPRLAPVQAVSRPAGQQTTRMLTRAA